MKKLFALFFSLLLGLTACSKCSSSIPAVQNPNVSLSPDLMEESVALVHKDGDGDWVAYCAGVWVSPTTILTANHCIEDEPKLLFLTHADRVELYEPPVLEHDATVLRIDADHDLALLHATHQRTQLFTHLAPSSPVVGSNLIIIGGPAGLTWTQLPGYVAGYPQSLRYGTETDGPFMEIAAGIYNGNSGGPVFDTTGRLVGIVILKSPAPGIGFGAHLDTIQKFLRNK